MLPTRSLWSGAAGIALLVFLVPSGDAQWTFVNLHVEGADQSIAACVKDGRQAGLVRFGKTWHAGYWEGSSSSWVDLHIEGEFATRGLGIDGEVQVGTTSPEEFISKAALWRGSPETFVSLHPAGVEYSAASEADGGQQVGFIRPTALGHFRAALWTGTAESFVELHPLGATYSNATSVRNGVQTGYASFGSSTRAGIWHGTKESWTEIHPAGYQYSEAYDISENQQVGFVWETFKGHNAAVWNGTAESFVNLRPNNFSNAYGVDEGIQVGVVTSGTEDYMASLWYGTAGSFVNLQDFVPSDFQDSEAYDVMVQGGRTYVVGSAFGEGGERAAMWVSEAISPGSFSMFRGSVFSGNLTSLQQSDDSKLILRPGAVLTTFEPPVQLRVNATAPLAMPNGFSFSVESSASFAFAQQTIALWNYDVGAYETLDSRIVLPADDTANVTVRTDPERFIEDGTLALRAIVRYRAVGPALTFPWSARVDRAWWTFPG